MIYVSRKEHFNAAHRVYNPAWTKERNEEVFGACANENWHGHNFELVVTVGGTPDPETGYVVDLKRLSELIKRVILDRVDHKNLNVDVPFMEGVIPSSENIVTRFWEILEPEVERLTSFGRLYSIRLYETPRNFVEYRGE